MPYKSKKQEGFFHANEGKKGLTPAVVNEFDQATKGKFASLPETAADGPGASPHGQLASHHAMLGAHYRGLAAEPGSLQAHHAAIAEHHRGLGVAHAALAEAMPKEEAPVIGRLKAGMKKRGLPIAPPPAPPGGQPPID
jgi:hypothetical protein